ncbi:MAG: hypothetical protein R3B93_00365 [Bacteroidia bacterium]
MIPQVVLTPTIPESGKEIIYLLKPYFLFEQKKSNYRPIYVKAGGVEFSKVLKNKMLIIFMATAHRLNATFPYILPIVKLPSNPPMEVMDAGAIDSAIYLKLL